MLLGFKKVIKSTCFLLIVLIAPFATSSFAAALPAYAQITLGSQIGSFHVWRKTVYHCNKPVLSGRKQKTFIYGNHTVTYKIPKSLIPVDCYVTAGPDQDVDGGFTIEVGFYKTRYDLLPFNNINPYGELVFSQNAPLSVKWVEKKS